MRSEEVRLRGQHINTAERSLGRLREPGFWFPVARFCQTLKQADVSAAASRPRGQDITADVTKLSEVLKY